MTFLYPQFLILLLLLPLAWRYLTRGGFVASSLIRMALCLLAILALARPRFLMDSPGSDLIVLVDRSASCRAEAGRMASELMTFVKSTEGTGDRFAVISFGEGTYLERGLSGNTGGMTDFESMAGASDLAGAMELAAAMRSPERRTAILCISDGIHTGRNPAEPGIVSGLEALPFWYRHIDESGEGDVAAVDIHVPEAVEPGSAWIVRYSIYSDAKRDVGYSLSRNGYNLAKGVVTLRKGMNHYFVRDTSAEEGLLEYRLDVIADNDHIQDNNQAIALLKVQGAPRVLVASSDNAPGLLVRSLEAAVIPVDRVAPENFPGSPAQLSGYKLVVLENCQLSAMPGNAPDSLAQAVKAGLCALLVTGGQNSFGLGGYHRSALDPLLPVEMELRNEKRRGTMAVAIALDRSGSMAVPAGNGRTKMDLANLGAAESIRLLSPADQVSVIAVDSAAHVIVPLSQADDVDGLVRRTLGIQSMGGGIFCYSALEAAVKEVNKSNLRNRHVILFADADDAEEQDGCIALVRKLRGDDIGASVIAMGKRSDSDADFLRQLARAGGGEALFSESAQGLPALFTQEIVRVSRRGFLAETVTPVALPPLTALGIPPSSPFPFLRGYNIAALRDGSIGYARLDDEFMTPIMATRIDGRTVTGAVLFEVDGDFSGGFAKWDKAPELIVSLARRLAAGVASAEVKSYSQVGNNLAEVRLEFAKETANLVRGSDAKVKWLGPGGKVLESPLEWESPQIARSRTEIALPGHYLPTIDLPGVGLATAPAVSVSYNAEFMPHGRFSGLTTLKSLADATGGGEGLDIAQVRNSAEAVRRGGVDCTGYMLAAIVILFLTELSGRRLLWFR